ncbi:ciliary microtubule inner protein 1-like isoform X2 [Argopecten irradians]|uniref:ciliary microtubule inner protein 1-like isoform X2 n=1 Tax=Argopecten irradians TaxID=31199 RepID=UPI00371E2960
MAAAPADKAGKVAAGCNFVAQDQIWKDHVHHEETASKTWPGSWGFLQTKYEDLVKDDFPDWDKNKKTEPAFQMKPVTPIEEYIHVEASPKPFPKTTARDIGWRSTNPANKLEKYGKYAKPKGGLIRQLNWPTEAIN